MDIVEELSDYEPPDMAVSNYETLKTLLTRAAGEIRILRYDHERDIEKIAALQLEIDRLRAVAGAAVASDGFREEMRLVPRHSREPDKRWPEVGTHE